MKVAFRVDASLEIGSGHVMRCLTLATELREAGVECFFICRQHLGHMAEFVREHDFDVVLLPLNEAFVPSRGEDSPKHAAWLAETWQVDAEQTRQRIQALDVEWLVVDHYALDFRWESELRDCCKQIMVIDDLADRQHDCDLLLDQTLGRVAAEYGDLVPLNCKTVTGSEYALLRPEFSRWREASLQRRAAFQLQRIVVTMGGVDQDNVTGQVLTALKTASLPEGCQITVVMGAQAPHLSAVQAAAATMPWPTEVRVNISTMAEVMAESDLAIGAAGSTSWERCCLGLPTLMLVLAENQRLAAAQLEHRGAAQLLCCDERFLQNLANCLTKLNRASLLMSLSKQAARLVDGQGVRRVLHCLQLSRGEA